MCQRQSLDSVKIQQQQQQQNPLRETVHGKIRHQQPIKQRGLLFERQPMGVRATFYGGNGGLFFRLVRAVGVVVDFAAVDGERVAFVINAFVFLLVLAMRMVGQGQRQCAVIVAFVVVGFVVLEIDRPAAGPTGSNCGHASMRIITLKKKKKQLGSEGKITAKATTTVWSVHIQVRSKNRHNDDLL